MTDIAKKAASVPFSGQVIAPADPAYDAARSVFYGGIDKRPALIIRAAGTEDVVRAVRLARSTGADLAVKSGGHSIAGQSMSNGGITLDVSGMKRIAIDGTSRTAWAETGLTAAEYTNATGKQGLVTGFGDTGSVGIGGITLGGGIGYLVRKFGLTVDDVLAADVVTADGTLLHADDTNHPDLFWAIRGGGGNFGVVTRFRYRLHRLASVTGGMLILPATPDTITGIIAEAHRAPEELSAIANVMTAPPMPFLPPDTVGKPVIMALLCYAGTPESGEPVLARIRNLAAPLADMLRVMPYPDIYPPDQGGYHPVAATRTMFLDSVGGHEASAILTYLAKSAGTMAVCQLRVLGGAVARVPDDATAYAHRTSEIMANLATLYTDPADANQHESWVTDFMGAIRQTDTGAYVNFLGNEGLHRVRAAYPPPTWDRLVAVKRRYDPDNLFRNTQNIPPGP